MNVFEDLIGELKDENLLEDTVIEVKRPSNGSSEPRSNPEVESLQFEFAAAVSDDISVDVPTTEAAFDIDPGLPVAEQPEIRRPADDREFFRKRATEEVSSLQMVEHVLSGVEREHMKMPAAPYDDLEVKKALHKFLQVSGDVESDAHAEAEYTLLQETQGWHAALSARDKNVTVANIRRFCENSRPVLSSQALMALARFYRNSPFSEDVRSKFDYVMTRLFSRDSGLERRKLLFNRIEMVGHIKTLYANWSSISYHSYDENHADVELRVQRFNDLVKHFESLGSFDELLNADVFNTVRQNKEECGELFYVADIASAAIDCNIRLGNRYVDLLLKEKETVGPETIEEKYGYANDQIVSNAAGKTLLLVDLLKTRPEDQEFPEVEAPVFEQESFDRPRFDVFAQTEEVEKRGFSIFGINRWLIVATIVVAIASGGIYLWAEKFAGQSSAVAVAKEMDISSTDLKEHLRTVRGSKETVYGVTQPSWDALSEEEKKQFLKKVFDFAQKNGYVKVNLLNYKARTVAYASKDRFELMAN